MSQAACPSQHATPVAIVPRVQVAPASVEYARKMLLCVGVRGGYEVVWVGRVDVHETLSLVAGRGADVYHRLEAGQRHEHRSVGLGARSLGFMHLRVPSGTSMPSVAAGICACKMDVAGVRNAKTAASTVRWRRVFICVFLLM